MTRRKPDASPLPNFGSGRNEDKLRRGSASRPPTLSGGCRSTALAAGRRVFDKLPMRNTPPIHCNCMGNVLPVRPTMEGRSSHLSCAYDRRRQGRGGSREGHGGIKEGSSVGARSDGCNCGPQRADRLGVEGANKKNMQCVSQEPCAIMSVR